jgi:hypothetical protein
MSTYKDALRQYLEGEETQGALANQIGKTQASVSRYVAGVRFPDVATARLIDAATAGAVPFALWQAEAMARIGLGTEAA